MVPFWEKYPLLKERLEIIQVNLGNLCNQACKHCHIGASPRGKRVMDEKTARLVCDKIEQLVPRWVEFTGGTPEMVPCFEYMLKRLAGTGVRLAVRTSATVLDEKPYSRFAELYRKFGVKVIASVPDATREVFEGQRGRGTFAKTLRVLERLNELGYGNGQGLELELVYNPAGPHLPPPQKAIEEKFRALLGEKYGIRFNRLVALTNSPINRFKRQLERAGKIEQYIDTLKRNFRPENVESLMCRRLLSVDYRGRVYDCDFNLARDMPVKGCENTFFWEIDFDDFRPEVSCDEHCWACTAGAGSSCHGQLDATFDATSVVKDYYGKQLTSSADLKTSCCTASAPPARIAEVIRELPDEVVTRFYGCGSPIPGVLEGSHVVDLGCGTGRDVFVLSKLVGPRGRVTGIDMTLEQLEVAQRWRPVVARQFGMKRSNVRFVLDRMENLDSHVKPGTIDLVVSNCVINLVEDKELVLRKVYRALRNGGEMYFSDVYCDRRLPEPVRTDPVLYGECLGGALYWQDFLRIARRVGFADPRVVERKPIELQPAIKAKVGPASFWSVTVRLWKIDGLEDLCEDYGHVATYRGGIEDCPDGYLLDQEHFFEKGRPERVCGNTALMLSSTRLAPYFDVQGSFDTHFGLFPDCGTSIRREPDDSQPPPAGCCC
ncbi:MAG: radical SAM/Cys-rich domain protein [Deltaproteobacteria bacterium]|nr:MAG: radical SAM/Cys-rich domain protein [Deltaproteobacteria bacterium]